jgi:hypothetical protein
MAQGMKARIGVEIALKFHVRCLTSQCFNAKRLAGISQGSEHKLASGGGQQRNQCVWLMMSARRRA